MFALQIRVFLLFLTLAETTYASECCAHEVTHALILARGGSKGIPDKNLLQLNGTSILARTIMTIRRSELFVHIWVSTDSDKIAKEAVKFGALLHMRPHEFARDNTTSLESVQEFLNAHPTIDKFALFQCTSVFLKESYIRAAVRKFETKECVFAVARSFKLRWSVKGADKVIPLNFNPAQRPRRQDWSGELIETGMFYFANRNLIAHKRFQSENCGVVEIDAKDALEIDTYHDYALAKCLVQSNAQN